MYHIVTLDYVYTEIVIPAQYFVKLGDILRNIRESAFSRKGLLLPLTSAFLMN